MLNNFQPVPQPTVHTAQIMHEARYTPNVKSAYAAKSDLQDRFNEVTCIDTEQVWEWIKAEHRCSITRRTVYQPPQSKDRS